MLKWLKQNNELLFWPAALMYLYWFTDLSSGHTWCVWKMAGFDFCPGCGIGRSMHAAMHLNWQESVHYHWLGIPAVLIVFYRIIVLILQHIKNSYVCKISG